MAIGLAAAVALRRPVILAAVGLAVVGADSAALGLKHVFGRERPPLRFAEPAPLVDVPGTPSFPSGHASTSFAAAVVLASFAPRLRWPLLALAALVAWSRVYVGVHYPLDVLAGAALGAAVGVAVNLVFLGRRWHRPGVLR